ncbi:MAG: hypothetical protein KDC52_02230 [Ignavibacteriae bacterium]|nr:hypothetical protein [Ignavibacteriota bacterium]
MKNIYLFCSLILVFVLNNCAPVKYVNQKTITPITFKSANTWSLEECNNIIDYYTVTNNEDNLFNAAPLNPDVFIRVVPLNNIVIQALAQKEVIEKRLDQSEFNLVLKNYLEAYTSFTADTISGKIIDMDSSFTKGFSFKVFFENMTDPFEPIFLEDGYAYFFLENMKGNFSRVIEVTGLYVEDYIQLDGYLNVIITFSPFAADGKRLFDDKDLNESYRMVFNGLEKDPIVIQWNLK